MNPKDGWCSMCYSPKNEFAGGLEHNNHVLQGQFCSRKCFDLWVNWKVAFLEWCDK
jgi:hypothetical protein